MGWALLGAAILLALLHSNWWWILAALLGLWRANQWYFYNGRPWRKIHYPLMRVYAREAGIETNAATREGRSFDIEKASVALVKQLHADWDDRRARAFVQKQISRCETLEDEELIVQEFRRRNPKLGDSDARQVRDLARQLLIPPDNATIIRFIVAAVVEENHGQSQRAEYLAEVLNGKAN
jgi:hypothetical protein